MLYKSLSPILHCIRLLSENIAGLLPYYYYYYFYYYYYYYYYHDEYSSRVVFSFAISKLILQWPGFILVQSLKVIVYSIGEQHAPITTRGQ